MQIINLKVAMAMIIFPYYIFIIRLLILISEANV